MAKDGVPKKRPAEGDPDGAQPLAKRLGRMHLLDEVDTFFFFLADPSPAPGDHDPMLLDDTKTTTYIYDLDRELAEDNTTEGDALIFLPGIAQMMSIPKSASSAGKELVLYQDASSLTVPRESDWTRRAIEDFRARARSERRSSTSATSASKQSKQSRETNTDDLDDDPMDIDKS
ncbi:hypothetical protein N7474_002661 [Penicillium riverlandense]|uniref:uncharacterized protein n=1 Tax=Penicillium riverlandense TaxID=1903569 RepID=UPI002548B8E7|nr:uncharacterized protein N7474_002661 [Penicillium riverlandense]KAJ5825523.1 hypothetical protein N7474_002661 [Penicillium riverlandense]